MYTFIYLVPHQNHDDTNYIFVNQLYIIQLHAGSRCGNRKELQTPLLVGNWAIQSSEPSLFIMIIIFIEAMYDILYGETAWSISLKDMCRKYDIILWHVNIFYQSNPGRWTSSWALGCLQPLSSTSASSGSSIWSSSSFLSSSYHTIAPAIVPLLLIFLLYP